MEKTEREKAIDADSGYLRKERCTELSKTAEELWNTIADKENTIAEVKWIIAKLQQILREETAVALLKRVEKISSVSKETTLEK